MTVTCSQIGKPFLSKGPIYLDGEHVFSLKSDAFVGDAIDPDQMIFPDGSSPEYSDPIPEKMYNIIIGAVRPDK